MNKRLLVAIVALMAIAAACGSDDGPAADDSPTTTTTTTTTSPAANPDDGADHGDDAGHEDDEGHDDDADHDDDAAHDDDGDHGHDDGGGSTTSVPGAEPQAEYVITGGTVEGPQRLEVGVDELVVISVTADAADEVHVHGYDVFTDLVPGETAVISFVASIPGIFEVELEGTHTLLLELVVQ